MTDDPPLVSPADASPEEIWLSVITPVLNGERFIAGCIENVAGQNTPGVEHLIMDGMSADETVPIATRLAGRNPSIRISSEKDRGQAAAMNHGIRLARGSIIGFLNVDDFYASNVLNRLAEIFREAPEPSLVVGNCNLLDAGGNVLAVNRPRRLTFLDLVKGREYPWNPSSYFYHKSLHGVIGGYDENEHYVMDMDFLFRAVQKAHVIYFDEVWGNFRWIEGTKTFGESKAGLMQKKCEDLRRKFSRRLSWPGRLQVAMFRLLRPLFHRAKRMLSPHG